MRQKPCNSVQLEREVELTSIFIGCPLIHNWLAQQKFIFGRLHLPFRTSCSDNTRLEKKRGKIGHFEYNTIYLKQESIFL